MRVKIQELIVNSICSLSFLYFLVPVAIEYFNYATVTNTYLPHFYPNFPRPKLYLISDDRLINISTLNDLMMVDGDRINITFVSSHGSDWNRSMFRAIPKSYEPNRTRITKYHIRTSNELIPTSDHVIGWKERSEDYKIVQFGARLCQLIIKYDGCDDQTSVPFKRPPRFVAISAQIFRISPPPYGQCRDLNTLTNSNLSCMNIRYFRFIRVNTNVKSPNAILASSISMFHEPDYKFPFSLFFILILGMIGLFSDITATSIASSIFKMHSIDISNTLIKMRIVLEESAISKHRWILTYFGLCILCMYHVFIIINQYSQYDIQSTMYEGPPINKFRPITAKMCVEYTYTGTRQKAYGTYFDPKYVGGSLSGTIKNLMNTLVEFKVKDCSTYMNFTKEDNGNICVELIAIDNCRTVAQYSETSDYPVYFEWKYEKWKAHQEYGKQKIRISVYSIRHSSYKNNSIFYVDDNAGIHQYGMLYFRGEYLKYPYITDCNDYHSNNHSTQQLNCLEEAYLEYDRSREYWEKDNIGIIMTFSKHSMDMRVTASMTIFDCISCLSTSIGFWLGLCMLGSAELCIETFCTHKQLNIVCKILVLSILSGGLTYFLITRFEDYFKYDVSSDMSLQRTPEGLRLPPMLITISDYRAENLYNPHNKNYWTDPEFDEPNATDTAPSAMEHCNYFLNRSNPLENMYIVDSDGHTLTLNQHSPTCYIHRRSPILRVDIGKLLGHWNPDKHKYLAIKLDRIYKGYGMYQISHESGSVVEIHSLYHSHGRFYREIVELGYMTHGIGMYRFFTEFKIQLDYLYQELLKPPYRTKCQEYRDPETHHDSWYYCLINTTMNIGRINTYITISGKNNQKRYLNPTGFMSFHAYTAAMKCIKKAMLELPCMSLISKTVIQSKDPLHLPGMILIEPKSTVITIFSPKTRPVDFFILLFDQIGFWLGINFVFVCFHFTRYSSRILNYIRIKIKRNIADDNGTENDTDEDIDRNCVSKVYVDKNTGRRMNAMKYWNVLRKNRNTINKEVSISSQNSERKPVMDTVSRNVEKSYGGNGKIENGDRMRISIMKPAVTYKRISSAPPNVILFRKTYRSNNCNDIKIQRHVDDSNLNVIEEIE